MNTSDSRGSTTVTQTESSQNSNTRSSESTMFPKKDLAIIMNTAGDLKLIDYVLAIGNIIDPKNISFASRISNNRICIYVKTINLVDLIIQNHSNLTINGHDISVRRLITPARRLIISNVCPSIPNSLIENTIKNIGLRLVSSITLLRAGLPGSGVNHILSFRRQVYVQPDENIQLPSSLVIKHEETNYRIYFTYDNMTCFVCKQAGHVARDCPNATPITPAHQLSVQENLSQQCTTAQNNIPQEPITVLDNISQEPSSDQTNPSSTLVPMDLTVNQSIKRTAPSTTSASDISRSTEDFSLDSFLKPQPVAQLKPQTKENEMPRQRKKLKKSQSRENLQGVEEMMLPIKKIMESQPSSFVLNFQQLVDYFENIHGSPDVIGITQLYSSDLNGVLDTLTKIYPYLEHRTLKARCTRVKKKLYSQLGISTETNATDIESDASQTSF